MALATWSGGLCCVVSAPCYAIDGPCSSVDGRCRLVHDACNAVDVHCSHVDDNCFAVARACSVVDGNCFDVDALDSVSVSFAAVSAAQSDWAEAFEGKCLVVRGRTTVTVCECGTCAFPSSQKWHMGQFSGPFFSPCTFRPSSLGLTAGLSPPKSDP